MSTYDSIDTTLKQLVPEGWLQGETIKIELRTSVSSNKHVTTYHVARVFTPYDINAAENRISAIFFYTKEALAEWVKWWFS